MIELVVGIARQFQAEICLTEDCDHANRLNIVCDVSCEVTSVLDLETIVAVYYPRFEDKLRSCFVDINLTPVGDFLK